MKKCTKCKLKVKHLYESAYEKDICGICYLIMIREYCIEMGIKLGCDCGCDGDFWEERMEEIRKEVKGE